MDKKDIIIFFGIVIFAVVIAYVLNVALTYFSFIPTALVIDNWLLFWGRYIGGVATLVAVFLTIRQNNKNHDRLISQQTALIERQYKEKKLAQYNECLKNNLELLNIADSLGLLATLRHSDLVQTKEAIVKKKSLIFSYDLQFRYVSKIDLHGCSSQTEQKCFCTWVEARKILSDILDLQLSFVEIVNQNQNFITSRKLNLEMILELGQRLNMSLQNGCNIESKESEYLIGEIEQCKAECAEAEESIRGFKTSIDNLLSQITSLSTKCTDKTKELFDLSTLLIEEKEKADMLIG